MELNNIYLEDCREFIPRLSNNFLNMVITSPPYNEEIEYDCYSDNLDYNKYLSMLHDVFKGIYPKLKKGGRV